MRPYSPRLCGRRIPSRAGAVLEALEQGLLESMDLAASLRAARRPAERSEPSARPDSAVRLAAGTRRSVRGLGTIRRSGVDRLRDELAAIKGVGQLGRRYSLAMGRPRIPSIGAPIASWSATAGSIRPRTTTRLASCWAVRPAGSGGDARLSTWLVRSAAGSAFRGRPVRALSAAWPPARGRPAGT